MQADLPHTQLPKDKNTPSQADIDDATRKTLEAIERKKKREQKQNNEGKEQYTIEELFEQN